MGEPMVPPWIPPPSDARGAGGPGLKDSYFYSNEVSTTRTGEKVAQWQYSNILQLKSPACRIEKNTLIVYEFIEV